MPTHHFRGLALVVVLLAAGCGGGTAGSAVDSSGGDPDAAKLTVAGDSVALGFGIALRDWVEGNPETVVVRAIGEDGTGLARPDTFDWPSRLGELARDFPPEVLVFSVGSNDAQDLTDSAGAVVALRRDSEAWDAEYSDRLARSFDAFEDTGTTVVWLGHVRTEVEDVADTNRHIHDLATRVAEVRPWVQVQDLAELTGSGADDVSECLADGLHLSATCYRDAAPALLDRLPL